MTPRTIAIAAAILACGSPALAGRPVIGGGIQITLSRPNLPSPGVFQTVKPGHGSRITGFENGWSPCRPLCQPTSCRTVCQPTACYVNTGFWVNGYWYPGYPNSPYYPLAGEVDRESDPPVVNIVTAELPPPDPAMVDLREKRYASAAAVFLRRHTERVAEEQNAEGVAIPDRTYLRLCALALAGAGEFEESALRFAEAYADDPLLGSDPINGEQVLASLTEARQITIGAVRFANRTPSTDAWAQVGYLMQTEGRFDRARLMMDRAESMRAPTDEVPLSASEPAGGTLAATGH